MVPHDRTDTRAEIDDIIEEVTGDSSRIEFVMVRCGLAIAAVIAIFGCGLAIGHFLRW